MASNKASKHEHLSHGFGPFYDAESKILILGSFPSAKSREVQFYYGHPVNRFWPVLSNIFGINFGKTTDDKKRNLKLTHIALYDVIESCDVIGSSDASIKNPIVSDISSIISKTSIQKILINGKKAGALFEKYQLPIIGASVPYRIMPSTSPANAAYRLEDLVRSWAPEFNLEI